jgi:hypothetical protein
MPRFPHVSCVLFFMIALGCANHSKPDLREVPEIAQSLEMQRP